VPAPRPGCSLFSQWRPRSDTRSPAIWLVFGIRRIGEIEIPTLNRSQLRHEALVDPVRVDNDPAPTRGSQPGAIVRSRRGSYHGTPSRPNAGIEPTRSAAIPFRWCLQVRPFQCVGGTARKLIAMRLPGIDHGNAVRQVDQFRFGEMLARLVVDVVGY